MRPLGSIARPPALAAVLAGMLAAILAGILAWGSAAPAAARSLGGPNAFDFVAIGDMPYTLPEDYVRFARLIAAINRLGPAFTIHVGDIRGDGSRCSDEVFARIKGYFDSFAAPLIYTPGDNEWTDCGHEAPGGYDPLERLAKLRALFFPDARSQGARKLELVRQADLMPADKLYVENARWVRGKLLFVTVHVVGSNNDRLGTPAADAEYAARNAANLAWIQNAYAEARRQGYIGIVFAMQANPMFERRGEAGSGFADTLDALEAGAVAFGKPVLLIQGDAHRLLIDRPFRMGADEKSPSLETFTRLQLMGDANIGGVRVLVDPDWPGLFAFEPIYLPENAPTPATSN
jgi:hypothetical protein